MELYIHLHIFKSFFNVSIGVVEKHFALEKRMREIRCEYARHNFGGVYEIVYWNVNRSYE